MIQPKLSAASAYIPASNCARANASRTLRDSGSACAAWFSRVTAAAALPPSSRSRPRVYQSYTSPWGRTSGGGGGASANGGGAAASSSQRSSSRFLSTGGPPLSFSVVRVAAAGSALAVRRPRYVHPVCGPGGGRRRVAANPRPARPPEPAADSPPRLLPFGHDVSLAGAARFLPSCPQRSRLGAIPRVEVRHGGDRKSIRLNSSHPSSSYAVFCLK